MDPYSVLGLESSATPEEIRSTYRIRAQLLHPDRHREAPQAVRDAADKAMRELNAAYEEVVAGAADLTPPKHDTQPPRMRKLRCPACGALTPANAGLPTVRSGGCGRTLRETGTEDAEDEDEHDSALWIHPPDPDETADDCAQWFVERLGVAIGPSANHLAPVQVADFELLGLDALDLTPRESRRVNKLMARIAPAIRAALEADQERARRVGLLDRATGLPSSWTSYYHRASDAQRYPVAAELAAVIAGLDQ